MGALGCQGPLILLGQHVTPFLISCVEPQAVPEMSNTHFHQWTHRFGVSMDPRHLPASAAGLSPEDTSGELSVLREHAPVALLGSDRINGHSVIPALCTTRTQ